MLERELLFTQTWCKLSYDLLAMPIPSDCKIIFAVMQDKAKKSQECKITAAELSELTNIPFRSVNRALHTLKQLEFIDSCIVRKGRETTYYINPLPLK